MKNNQVIYKTYHFMPIQIPIIMLHKQTKMSIYSLYQIKNMQKCVRNQVQNIVNTLAIMKGGTTYYNITTTLQYHLACCCVWWNHFNLTLLAIVYAGTTSISPCLLLCMVEPLQSSSPPSSSYTPM